jgi:hypothetical protein
VDLTTWKVYISNSLGESSGVIIILFFLLLLFGEVPKFCGFLALLSDCLI